MNEFVPETIGANYMLSFTLRNNEHDGLRFLLGKV